MEILLNIKRFTTHDAALRHLEYKRWGGKFNCVYCKSTKICKHNEKNKYRWQCWDCKKSFAVTVGTVFHGSRVSLDKWFALLSIMLKTNNKISSYSAADYLGIRRATVWSMMSRIQKALTTEECTLLKSII